MHVHTSMCECMVCERLFVGACDMCVSVSVCCNINGYRYLVLNNWESKCQMSISVNGCVPGGNLGAHLGLVQPHLQGTSWTSQH